MATTLVRVLLLVLAAPAAFAALSVNGLQNRLQSLEPLRRQGLDVDALVREIGYEAQNLDSGGRARLEAQRMLEQVRLSVVAFYDAKIAEGLNTEAARAEVRAHANRDLERFTPAVADGLREVMEATLANPRSSRLPAPSPALLAQLEEASRARQATLHPSLTPVSLPRQRSDEGMLIPASAGGGGISGLSINALGVRAYDNRQEMAQALANSDESSERWVATASLTMESIRTTGYEEQISLQVRAEFLGIEISAGPILKFRRLISSMAIIMGEGMSAMVDSQGHFDFTTRDASGRVVTNRRGRRFISFSCRLEARLENEAGMAGGFKLAGVGGTVREINAFNQNIRMDSRWILVPDTIGGRRTHMVMLDQTCHNEFVNARLENGRTVKQNLDASISAFVGSLIYVNDGLDCVQPHHCREWFRGQHPFLRNSSVPACIPSDDPREVTTCAMRGVDGAKCPVMYQGRRVSSGFMELECSEGFTCVPNRDPATRRGIEMIEGRCRGNSGRRRGSSL